MRLLQMGLAVTLGLALAAACGSDSSTGFLLQPDGGKDSSAGTAGSAAGGTSGASGTAGSGGSAGGGCSQAPNCAGCQGCFLKCMCEHNDAAACNAQCSGTGGSSATGGTAGTGGTGGTSGGGTSGSSGTSGSGGSSGSGSCNKAFCPSIGVGQPCCVTPNGPCGTDDGQGCMANPGADF